MRMLSRSCRGTVTVEALPRTVLAMITLYRETPSLTGAAAVVLVMATPPMASFVAPLGSAVEPLPHAPQSIQPARIRRIRVVDDAILQNEGTHPRPLAQERGPIDSSPPDIRVIGTGSQQRALATIVVFDAALALLFFG